MNIWIKFRHRWAWGYSDWEHVEVDSITTGDPESIKEACSYFEQTFSDKYRGIEFMLLGTPSKEVLEKKRKSASRMTEYYKRQVEKLTEQIDSIFDDEGETTILRHF